MNKKEKVKEKKKRENGSNRTRKGEEKGHKNGK